MICYIMYVCFVCMSKTKQWSVAQTTINNIKAFKPVHNTKRGNKISIFMCLFGS